MVTYQNQKVVRIRSEPHDREHPYGMISRVAMGVAARVLGNGTAFTMYVYMAANQNDYSLALSPKAVQAEMGLTIKQYRRAVKLLIECGFLVQTREGSNRYDFYEWPVAYKGTIPDGVDMPRFSPTLEGHIPPEGDNLLPQRDIEYPPVGAEVIPPEGAEIEQEIIQNTEDIQESEVTTTEGDEDDLSEDNLSMEDYYYYDNGVRYDVSPSAYQGVDLDDGTLPF